MTNEQAIAECMDFWSNRSMGSLIFGLSSSVVRALADRGVIVLRHRRSPNDPPESANAGYGRILNQSPEYLAFLTTDISFLRSDIGMRVFGYRNSIPHKRVSVPSGYEKMYCLVRQGYRNIDLNRRGEMFAYFPTSVLPYNGKLSVDGRQIEVERSEILNKEREILLQYMWATVGRSTGVDRFEIINDRKGEPTERFEIQMIEKYKEELRKRIEEKEMDGIERLNNLDIVDVEKKDMAESVEIFGKNQKEMENG